MIQNPRIHLLRLGYYRIDQMFNDEANLQYPNYEILSKLNVKVKNFFQQNAILRNVLTQ